MDAHRKRHLNQDYPKPGNKRKGAYGCCLDLFVSRYTSEIANSSPSRGVQLKKGQLGKQCEQYLFLSFHEGAMGRCGDGQ